MGSVEVVHGPVHRVVCGPGLLWGPQTGGQCFGVTRNYVVFSFILSSKVNN